MFKNKKIESEGLDNFLRLFPKLMKNKELTLLQKLIISDVISRQIQGQPYFKTSSVLAEELGTYKKKTIQMNFQYLESLGYLNTQPYNDGKHTNDLREAEVIQIEKWIFPDDFLEKSKINIAPTVRKIKDDNYTWSRKRRKSKLVLSEKFNPEIVEEYENPMDVGKDFLESSEAVEEYLMIEWDNLESNTRIGQSLIDQFKDCGDFPFVTIMVTDGTTKFEDEAIKVQDSGKYYLKSTLMMIDETLFPE
jgi:hypothetical protein